MFDFTGMRVEDGMRFFLSNFLLKGEPGFIERVLGVFS